MHRERVWSDPAGSHHLVSLYYIYNISQLIQLITKLKLYIMKIKKGMKLVFNNRSEIIIKGSNDRVNGIIVTDGNEYSVDFIMRWLEFGCVKLEKG